MDAQTRRLVGRALVALGLVLVGAGIIGWLGASDDAETAATQPVDTDAVAEQPTSTTTTTAAPATTALPTTTTTTVAPETTTTTTTTTTSTEPPRPELTRAQLDEFVVVFTTAIAERDVDTLLARLHPAVLAVFDEASCRTAIETQMLLVEDFSVGETLEGPTVQTFTTAAGPEINVETWQAPTRFTFQGQLIADVGSWGVVDGEVRWFLGCGG